MTESKRHPDIPGCVVRLTDDAVDDLRGLFRVDPQIVRWALKKILHLERDPHAGEPLLGGLIGFRKIVVGDRDWRVIWRIEQDEAGGYVVDVAEIWAVGYRKDSEVYVEVQDRVARAASSPRTRALTEVLELFAKQAHELTATPMPLDSEPIPKWLTEALVYVVKIPAEQVAGMNLEEAEGVWTDYISGPGT